MSQKFIIFCAIFSLFINQGRANVEDCASALSVIQNDLTRYSSYKNLTALTLPPANTSINFFVYSGRTINDFGEFDTCQQETQSHYLTMFFSGTIPGNSAKLAIMLGFCAPLVCSAGDAKANADTILELYLQGMGLPLSKLTTPAGTNFYDPNNPNIKYDESTWIIWVILLAVVGLSVAGTLMNILFEMKDEARIKPQELSLGGIMSPERETRRREFKGVLKFLDCFDVKKNMSRLVTVKYTEQYDYNLEIFNGIRVLMFMYVVYGHTYLFGTNYADNVVDFVDITKTWWFLVPFSALYSVDVFFYMSGFFFAFIALGKLEKMRPGFKSFIFLALHRLFRIWPTYAIAIVFFWKVLPYMGGGPVWFQMTYFTSLCDDGNVIDNLTLLDDFLVKSETYCYGWGWYLSNDFQMFLLTPWFLWIYINNKRKGKIYMGALIVISITFAIFYGDYLGVKASPPTTGGITNPNVFRLYYVKPYIRLPPYFIGVLAGLFYKEYKEKDGWSYHFGEACRRPLLKWTLQILGFAWMMFIVFYVRQVQSDSSVWSPFFHAIWRGTAKSAYVIAMTMIILPSVLGEDTLMKRILSHPLWTPLARMAFSAYLVHLFWVMRGFYNETAAFHFTTETVLYYSLANIGISLGTACILSVLAEVPLANIEATYISKRKPHSKSHSKEPVKHDYKAPALHEERKLALTEISTDGSSTDEDKAYNKMPEDA